ncbi:4125_t:CDS:2, partial [Scutellospora calospora]
LSDSANNDPPTKFSNMNGIGRDFDKWARSKEYRGYIHISSFNVKCDAKDYLVLANPRDPDYRNQENPTKNPEKVTDAEAILMAIQKSLKHLGEPIGFIKLLLLDMNRLIFIRRTQYSMGFNPNQSIIRLYIDGKIVGEREQTDISKFIQSGGSQLDASKLSKAGHRKIAHSDKLLTYNKKVEKVIPA